MKSIPCVSIFRFFCVREGYYVIDCVSIFFYRYFVIVATVFGHWIFFRNQELNNNFLTGIRLVNKSMGAQYFHSDYVW